MHKFIRYKICSIFNIASDKISQRKLSYLDNENITR